MEPTNLERSNPHGKERERIAKKQWSLSWELNTVPDSPHLKCCGGSLLQFPMTPHVSHTSFSSVFAFIGKLFMDTL